MKKKMSVFCDVVSEARFIYCHDENNQYIIDKISGAIIYKKNYILYGKSFFCYAGETEKGPAFYDARYSTYIYPTADGYRIHEEIFKSHIMVNNINAANITETEKGLHLIDSFGNLILENFFDKLTVSIKIRGLKDGNKIEKIIPLSKIVFEKGK